MLATVAANVGNCTGKEDTPIGADQSSLARPPGGLRNQPGQLAFRCQASFEGWPHVSVVCYVISKRAGGGNMDLLGPVWSANRTKLSPLKSWALVHPIQSDNPIKRPRPYNR